MSTSPAQPPAPKDPFGPLSAILTGLVLGLIAFLLAPNILPLREAWHSLAQTTGIKADPGVNDSKVSGGAPAGAASASPPGQLNGSTAPEPAKETPKEPVLVPAIDMSFPKPFSSEEMTSALQPLLSFKLSDEDAKAVKEAFEAAARDDDEDARAAIKKISDPAAKTFAEWKRLRQHDANFDEIMAFRAAHPLFPEPPQDALTERNLFLSNARPPAVLKYYRNRVPLTGAGHASLGAALIETGERERGSAMVKYAWHRYALDPTIEAQFRSRYGAILNADDDSGRQRMLAIRATLKEDKVATETSKKGLRAAARHRGKSAKSGRGTRKKLANRRGRQRAAIRIPQREAALGSKARQFGVSSLMESVRVKKQPQDSNGKDTSKSADKKTKKADDEKPSVTLQTKAAENAVNLSKQRSRGPSTLLAHLKALRHEGDDNDNELWSVLRSLVPDSADLAEPDRWWDFRRGEIRHALSEDHPKTAYAIAKAHGPLEGENLSEAEFLAGWVALRFLKDPQRAISHFEASRVAGFARTEARADYWLARSKQELGRNSEAQAFLVEAGKRFYTFYGALARQTLRKTPACEFRAPVQPSKDAIAAFVNEDAFKAVIIAKQLDLDSVLITYVLDLARQIDDPEQMTLVMELAARTVPVHVAVRAAKIALLRGFPVDAYAYPTLLPKFDQAGGNAKVELALLNALTRQESEFHTGTISRVGARGLMQLMPQTAKHVAAAIKVKYDVAQLISDPSYNVTLGSVFLAQLLSGYDGSYALTLAAYNAGPGRITDWIKDFGDPRDKSVDPVDWVERIPFAETRNYVQHILESVQLYRCRLESGKTKLQIVEDLHRGRPGKIPDFTDVTGSADLDQTP